MPRSGSTLCMWLICTSNMVCGGCLTDDSNNILPFDGLFVFVDAIVGSGGFDLGNPRNIALKYTNHYPMYQYSRDCFEYTFFQTVQRKWCCIIHHLVENDVSVYPWEKDANTMSNSLTLLLSPRPLLASVSKEPQYSHAVIDLVLK